MARDVYGIVGYAKRELATFQEKPLNRVDSLIFSWLSYFLLPDEAGASVPAGGPSLRDLYRAEWAAPMCSAMFDPETSFSLLAACAASPRFREVQVQAYTTQFSEEAGKQFSAMTFELAPTAHYIAFRGTDSSLVGWKEDFEIAFEPSIPSQEAARDYLEERAQAHAGDLWVGGHSKGGNLAVYAAACASEATRARLVRCFSHDGPGFPAERVEALGLATIASLVDKTIPQSSLVGMLFEHQEHDFDIVRSTNVGILQHAALSWVVDGDDFARSSDLSMSAVHMDTSLNTWISNMSAAEREDFVDALFDVFAASGYNTFDDINAHWTETLPRMLGAVADFEPARRDRFLQALGDLFRIYGRPALPDAFSQLPDNLTHITEGLTQWTERTQARIAAATSESAGETDSAITAGDGGSK